MGGKGFELEHLICEKAWHDAEFGSKDVTRQPWRWLHSNIRSWFYSSRTARLADSYLYSLVPQRLVGMRAMELGCGLHGRIWLRLAQAQATTHSCDISMTALRQVASDAKHFDISTAFVNCAAEALPYADDSFDLVVGEAILHHTDLKAALAELHRVTKPGGLCLFREPLQGHCILRLFRAFTPHDRTHTERPLTSADLKLIRSHFEVVENKYFFLLAPLALVVGLIHQPLGTWVWETLHAFDETLLARFPSLQRWCWQVVFVLGVPDTWDAPGSARRLIPGG